MCIGTLSCSTKKKPASSVLIRSMARPSSVAMCPAGTPASCPGRTCRTPAFPLPIRPPSRAARRRRLAQDGRQVETHRLAFLRPPADRLSLSLRPSGPSRYRCCSRKAGTFATRSAQQRRPPRRRGTPRRRTRPAFSAGLLAGKPRRAGRMRRVARAAACRPPEPSHSVITLALLRHSSCGTARRRATQPATRTGAPGRRRWPPRPAPAGRARRAGSAPDS